MPCSTLFREVALDADHHLDQATPDLLDEHHHPVEFGIARKLRVLVAATRGRRLISLHPVRQRQALRQHLLLERCVVSLQPGDLACEYGPLIGHRAALPARRLPRAHRDLAGAIVEPQEAVLHAMEAEASIVGARRTRGLRARRRCKRKASSEQDESDADHAVLRDLVCAGFAAAPWRAAGTLMPERAPKNRSWPTDYNSISITYCNNAN